jgi:hypothetical protein
MRKIFLCLIGMVMAFTSMSQEIERRTYNTTFTKTAPEIDGFMNDSCWNQVEWSGNFTQSTPYENKAPSQQTSFKILYDDDNLYVFICAHDSEANKISKILTRRDGFEGDMVEINIDSYYDKQTAFSFTAMASGAKGDEAVSQDGNNWDASWNPVWTLKTSINDKGWNAEMKIPLTQLRFGNKKEHIWGIQVTRYIQREDERSLWQFIPKGSPGIIHLFGELHGIKNIKPKRQVEILPYIVAKYETDKKVEGNPFEDGNSSKISAGIDGKIGITNDFTLDFTVNPDFGQVEADPSQVNLTAFESYFSEQRPFFVEGKSIYQFRPSNPIVINNFGSDNLFYSRRIGRYPQYTPDLDSVEYAKMPEATNILAAMKLSGKTKNGISIGILESLTANEKAEIDSLGNRSKESVEPFTNFFLSRVQKEFNKGQSTLGGMFTAVNRNIKNPALDDLHSAAYAGGIDFKHSWKERTWYVAGEGTFSNVQGNVKALLETQESSARYFQRPDASYVSVDSSITSLSGYGSSLRFGRQGQKKIQFETSLSVRSPGLEFNDVGYMRASDVIHHGTWMGYYKREPFSIFRNFYLNLNYWIYWDFGGNLLSTNANMNFNTQFKNKWYMNGSFSRQSDNVSNDLLRGGPSFIMQGNWNMNMNISTDQTKKIIFNAGWYYEFRDKPSGAYYTDFWAGARIKPINALSISLDCDYGYGIGELQYINTLNYNDDPRYILGEIDQKTLVITIRLDYTITPELSIQYYGQPFVSSAKFSKFKMVTEPHASNYSDRFQIYDANQIHLSADAITYNIDEDVDIDKTTDYSIDNPDFNVREFHSNLVVRWEYARGSTIFFVWSQGRSSSISNGNFAYWDDLHGLFGETAHNVFLIKLNFWLSI